MFWYRYQKQTVAWCAPFLRKCHLTVGRRMSEQPSGSKRSEARAAASTAGMFSIVVKLP